MKLSQEDMEEAWEHTIKHNMHLKEIVPGWWVMAFLKNNDDLVEFDLDIKTSLHTVWISGNQDLYAKEGGHYHDEKRPSDGADDTDQPIDTETK